MCRASTGSSPEPAAMASTTVNTTTPTPSLNSDSPAILASSASGTTTVLRSESTATGSVGLIRAPKTSAQASGRSSPSAPAIHHEPKPTMAVEMHTPSVAISAMTHFTEASSLRSTCIAPAKSRKASIPFMTRSKTSIPAMVSSTAAATSTPGA